MAPKTCALLAVLALWAALASCQGAPAAGQPTATRAAVELEPEAPQAAYENEAYPAAYDDDTADAAADGAAYPEWHDGAKLVDPPPDLELAGTTYLISASQRTVPRATLAELAAANSPRQQQHSTGPGPGRAAPSPAGELEAVRARLRRSGRRRKAAPRQKQQQPPRKASTLDAPAQHQQQQELLPPPGAGAAAEARVAGAHAPRHPRLSFDGLNAYDNSAANAIATDVSDEALQLEPPDQGLCMGNGFVLQTINTVMRVYDAASGTPLVLALATSAFLGLPPIINTTGSDPVFGPYHTDPSCRYDPHTRRWVHVVATTDLDPHTANFTGPTYLDVSVSEGADPTGYWRQYRIPASNNGAEGTPDLGCAGPNGICQPDFPQLAVWRDAVVITTNEFAQATEDFYGANVYALDKAALLKGAAQAATALVRTGNGRPASAATLDTLIPATQVGRCSGPNTYLMATPAVRFSEDSVDTLQLFSLLGTRSLRSPAPDVRLAWVRRDVKLGVKFTTPPFDGVAQRNSTNPLGIAGYSAGGFEFVPPGNNVSAVAAGDASMASVTFVDDHLYAAWGTGLPAADARLAGVAWARVDPRAPARASRDGVLGLAGNSLLFPSLAVRSGGLGVMAVVVVGPDHFPSAAYAVLSRDGLGRVTLLAPGAGPVDGFTGYLFPPNSFGDYSAAFVDEGTGKFWISSEYINQACSVAKYVADPTCGRTRVSLANWASRITRLEPLRGHV